MAKLLNKPKVPNGFSGMTNRGPSGFSGGASSGVSATACGWFEKFNAYISIRLADMTANVSGIISFLLAILGHHLLRSFPHITIYVTFR